MSADTETHEFDWTDDDADIVVKAQPAIAIYAGPAGVIIRRQGDWDEHDDGVVWFGVDQALAVAKAIMAAAELDAKDPEPARVASNISNSTAAARQKRYRDRKKKEPALFDGEKRDVTPRDDRNGSGDGQDA